jgi:hypothetical protein
MENDNLITTARLGTTGTIDCASHWFSVRDEHFHGVTPTAAA